MHRTVIPRTSIQMLSICLPRLPARLLSPDTNAPLSHESRGTALISAYRIPESSLPVAAWDFLMGLFPSIPEQFPQARATRLFVAVPENACGRRQALFRSHRD